MNRKETLRKLGRQSAEAFFPFETCVNMASEGKNIPDKDLYITQFTPMTLRNVGLDNLPVYISGKHVKSIVAPFNDGGHKHDIEKEFLLNILNYLNDPAIVFVSDNQDKYDAITVVTGIRDKKRQPVICSIHAPGEVNGTPVNYITSVYGKRQIGTENMIEKAVQNNTVLYINEKKCREISPIDKIPEVSSYKEIKQRRATAAFMRESYER